MSKYSISTMEIVRILWILVIVVSNCDNSLGVDSMETCPCSSSIDCAPMYQLYPGHTACFPKNKTVVKSGVSDSEKEDIVELHNELRGNVVPAAIDMLEMTWDGELAMLAQRFADTCVCNDEGKTYHDKLRFIPGRFAVVGQNLAWGQESFKDAITAWYKEHFIYDRQFGKPNEFLANVGHYTQLVWASSNKIGCGFSLCGKKRYYVCNYAPGGNEANFKKPYMDGPTRCSGCSKCDDGLCDCGDMECANGGTLDPKTCKCTCKYPTVNSQPNCHINCDAKDLAECGKEDPYLVAKCSYAFSACPHMCGVCACKEKTNKDGKCGSARTAFAVSMRFLLLAVFATHLLYVC